jgi:sulfhydrogenase subunit gamma (sulfur reductase)
MKQIPTAQSLSANSLLPTPAHIVEVHPLTQLEKLFTIQLPENHSLGHQPGQFVEVSVMGVGEAPISISSSPSRSNGSFELCVRRVGDLSDALHHLNPGDTLGIRGPYGRGFPMQRFRGKDLLFVIGGLGLAPARSVIHQVLDERGLYGRVMILYGARNPSELLFTSELAEWDQRDDLELGLTVDRPDETWKGHIGVITTLIPDLKLYAPNTIAITIGPPVMYRFVLIELLGKGLRESQIWLSLERRMKCGLGKCGHCQINQLYCCQDGPCFSYDQIKFVKEAL